jgi:hypothetical protein
MKKCSTFLSMMEMQIKITLTLSHSCHCKVLLNKDHTTCGKERFIGTRPQGCHSFWVQSGVAWLKMGSRLYRRGQAMGEGESLLSPIICDHQMEQVHMPG